MLSVQAVAPCILPPSYASGEYGRFSKGGKTRSKSHEARLPAKSKRSALYERV